MILYPLLFESNLRSMVWGGTELRLFKGLEPTDDPIGESWEVSAVPKSPSIVRNGLFSGRSLIDIVEEYPNEILGKTIKEKYEGKFPLLVKFIDAKSDLSIQVHPNDEMAKREHGMMGKTEMWYIIKAEQGAHLYSGFKQEITPVEYQKRIAEGTITEVLADHQVKTGDVFSIPAGRVHALCGGIMVAEVQQSSDITYRIFDYNRLGLDGKPRELHTDLAAQALDFHVEPNYRTEYKNEKNKAIEVINSSFFNVRVMTLTESFHCDMTKNDSFVIIMCMEGKCMIRICSNGEDVELREGNSALIPAAIADYEIVPCSKQVKLLDAYISVID